MGALHAAVLFCAVALGAVPVTLLVEDAARAERPVAADGTVSRVAVSGTRRIEDAVVLAAIGLRRGESINAAKIRRDLKAVYATGFFDDVRVDLSPDPDAGPARWQLARSARRQLVHQAPALADELEG